jgi:hypothetical protein
MRYGFAFAVVLVFVSLAACTSKQQQWPEPVTQEMESGRFAPGAETSPYNLKGLEGMKIPNERVPADASTRGATTAPR